MTLNSDSQGVLLKIANVFLISLVSVLIKKLLPNIGIFQIIFLTSCICMTFLVCRYYKSLPNALIPNKQHTARSLSNTFAILTWIYAIKQIPVSLATSISSVTPIASMILAVYFLGEKITQRKLIALFLGLIGMSIAINPVFAGAPIGLSLAFLSALLWAVHDTLTKKQTTTNSWVHQAFYTFLIAILLLTPFTIFSWKTPTITEMLSLLIISALMLINKYLLIAALTKTSLSLISPIIFCRFIFAAILGKVILDETTAAFSWYGTILVLFATAITFSTQELTYKQIKKL